MKQNWKLIILFVSGLIFFYGIFRLNEYLNIGNSIISNQDIARTIAVGFGGILIPSITSKLNNKIWNHIGLLLCSLFIYFSMISESNSIKYQILLLVFIIVIPSAISIYKSWKRKNYIDILKWLFIYVCFLIITYNLYYIFSESISDTKYSLANSENFVFFKDFFLGLTLGLLYNYLDFLYNTKKELD